MEPSIGRIFSIEEFSTFDGPGIRMTVFLKGCPLRCPWCHNPEGQRFGVEYMRNVNGCTGCGACERAGEWENGVLRLTEGSVEACPKNLVRRSGDDMTAQALAEKILKNADILRSTGGGVTFSGGEPLCQTDFIVSCAERLGDLSVALQTTGYAPKETFMRALSVCDYVLYDLKILDREDHKAICGVDNTQILENYRTLAASGKRFITRIPLIPGVVETEKNLAAIASFMRECGVTQAEVLPYNKLAGSKYAALLRQYSFEPDEELEPRRVEEIFASFGVSIKRM